MKEAVVVHNLGLGYTDWCRRCYSRVLVNKVLVSFEAALVLYLDGDAVPVSLHDLIFRLMLRTISSALGGRVEFALSSHTPIINSGGVSADMCDRCTDQRAD